MIMCNDPKCKECNEGNEKILHLDCLLINENKTSEAYKNARVSAPQRFDSEVNREFGEEKRFQNNQFSLKEYSLKDRVLSSEMSNQTKQHHRKKVVKSQHV